MNYKNILFDLDGTLTESAPGIINSTIYALNHYHIDVLDRSSLLAFIGPPLTESFQKYYHFSKEQAAEAVLVFREYYLKHGIFENSVYDGIPDLLRTLKNAEKNLYVATSKPELQANQILEHFHLNEYFDAVLGATWDETLTKKSDIIHTLLTKEQIAPLDTTIMVGDRMHDIKGAQDNQLSSIGVLYGYGSRKEFQEAGADYIVETVSDLKDLLLQS